MNSLQLALLSLGLGLVIGASIVVLIVVAFRARDKHMQESSTELPDGLAAVLEGMEDAAAVVDTSYLLTATSKAADWLGMHAGTSLGYDELRALVRRARESGVPEIESFRLRPGGVSSETRLVSARAMVLGGRLTLLTVRDTSEAERVEQMRHDFVANTSHELKTPVGAVTLLAEAIEMAADDADQVRHFATRLHAEAQRLGNLTARIMNLSRLQSADGLSETRLVSVDEVVASAVDSHTMQAESAGVELLRGGDRGLYVRGDVQILMDAVGNLVANAIAYSPEGSRVGVGVKTLEDAVEISVTDQGIGIPEGDQNRIFERFYRADHARSRRTGGTGLGLSIVKHAVQRHGGDVRLWSRPGRGSTFTITLPIVDPPQPHPDDEKPKAKIKARAKVKKLAADKADKPAKVAKAKAAKAAKTAKTKVDASGDALAEPREPSHTVPQTAPSSPQLTTQGEDSK